MMLELPNTAENITLIQDFLDETRRRIFEGVEITFTSKANSELQDLVLDFEIEIEDIEDINKKSGYNKKDIEKLKGYFDDFKNKVSNVY